MVDSRRVIAAPCPAHSLQIPGEALNVRAAHREQRHRPGAAPAGELAQVQRVRLPGQTAVPRQKPGEGHPFRIGEDGLDRNERSRWAAVIIGHLPARLEPEGWASPGPRGSTEAQRKLPGPVTLSRRQGRAVLWTVGLRNAPSMPSMRLPIR